MKKATLYLVLATLLAFSVSTTGFAQDAVKAAAADLEKGWENLDIPLLEKTAKTFEEMAKKDPKDPMAPYYAAKAHYAAADCLDVKSDKEWDQTGEGEKHIDAAIELIKASLTAKEDNADAHVLKFHILRRKMLHVSFPRLMMYVGDRRGAYARAKELAPESPAVVFLTGIETAEGAHPAPPPEKSIPEFEKTLEKDPKMADAYCEMGMVWQKANKPEEAKKNYNKALEVNPNHHWAKKRLAELAKSPGA